MYTRNMKMMVLFCASFIQMALASALNACPKCGGLEVPYPLSTNDNCGDIRYRIYCNGETLVFKSAKEIFYNILSINPGAYSLIISAPQIQKDKCYSPDLSLGGLRLDDNLPFNISTHNTVMLLNCSDSLLLSPLNCSSNSLCRLFEGKMEEASQCRNTLCCTYLKESTMTSHVIRVRVGGCTAYTSVVDMKPGSSIDSWNYGIELQWAPPT